MTAAVHRPERRGRAIGGRPVRNRLPLAGQFLVLQLGIVLLVVVAVAGVSLAQSTVSFRETEGRRLLSVAETVAATDTVRLGLVDPRARASLETTAESARGVSGASSVVIADEFGVLRTGPDVGRTLDLGSSAVRRGRAWVGEIGGHLVAHVPVLDATGSPVGIVGVGRRYPTLAERFATTLPNLVTYLVLGCLLGVVGSLLLARRVNRQTLGLAENEIAGLAEHREAMLHGIKEGVVAVDLQGRVTLVNDEATRLLSLPPDPVGRSLDSIGLSRKVRSVLTGRSTGSDLVVLHDDRVLVLNTTPFGLRGSPLGSVTTLRDRTEMVALQHELDVTRYATDALQSQARAFAGRMATVASLIEHRRYDDVARYATQASRAFIRLSEDIHAHVADPGVAALLVAKSSLAAADGVDLLLAPGSKLPGLDGAVSVDVVAVLAAMLDHALSSTRPRAAWLEVLVQFGLDAVYLAVRDSAHVVVVTVGESTDNAWDTRPLPSDRGPLDAARMICARRGGQAGWEGEARVLEAWLPVGSGAP
jgi:two-component system, CitB family, sensor kinase